MKYVILCGGKYPEQKPLYKINGERLVERTIKLLKENNVQNIVISVNSDAYDYLKDEYGVEIVENVKNNFVHETKTNDRVGYWLDCFLPSDEPVCYLFGDVYYSKEAIEKIVGTYVDWIMLFGSKYPFDEKYIKKHEEPFAFKVRDTKTFFETIDEVKGMYDKGLVNRHPISWELYRVLNGYDINTHIIDKNYCSINDITCDLDEQLDIIKMEEKLNER